MAVAPVCSRRAREQAHPPLDPRLGLAARGVAPRRRHDPRVGSRWDEAIEASGEDEWVALAVETKGSSFAVGSGTYPEQALTDLVDRLLRDAGETRTGSRLREGMVSNLTVAQAPLEAARVS